MAYKCLKENCFKKQDYQIVAIRQEDIESIRLWRNAQIDVLRQKHVLTQEVQQRYFQKHVWPTFQQESPSQILFSFLFHNVCIGYGGLTYLDWENGRAEVSFLVDPLRAEDDFVYRQDFAHFLALLCHVAFEHLHLHRLFSETYAFRQSTLEVFKQLGFKQEGILREHVYKQGRWVDSIMYGLLAKEWHQAKTLETAISEMIEFEKKVVKEPSLTEHPAVLITSISKKMPLIEAVRSAANKLGQFQEIHGCDSNDCCIGQYGVDKFWHCSPLDHLIVDDVIAYCQENKITAIIPTRDADLEFYASHLKRFHKHGIYPMISSLETIQCCLDKKKFAELLERYHFPFIPTSLSLEQCHSHFYVVKERRGAGSHQLGLRLTLQEALEHSQELNQPIFQPFIEGQEWSVDLYRSFEGKVKGCIARQRNYIVNGESQVTTTAHYPGLEHLCQKMADLLKIQGHAVFQLIVDKKGDFHVIECNPRFGGASTAGIAAGLDSFVWFFVECLGLSLHDYPFMRCKGEIRQVRYMTDRLLPWSSYLI